MTFVGSIRADVTKTVFISGALVAVVAAACASPTPPGVDFGEGTRFVEAVADSQDDVGQGASIAYAADGTPYVSYFGFAAELEEGEIPLSRPVGTPFLPAVLLTSVSPEGVFTRGAVAQLDAEFQPSGVEPAFRPAKIPGLDVTPENANGTAVAVAGDGSVHVAWTSGNGVFHAVAKPGSDSVVTTVFELGFPVSQAGPVGRPSIAIDSTNQPWIAFGVTDGSDVTIDVATPDGEGWAVQDAATAGRCNGCPPPLPTAIVAPGDVPMVAFGDPVDSSVYAARLDGDEWVEELVESGASGAGMAGAVDDESAYLTFYGEAEVRLATWDGAGWTTESAAESTDPQEVSGLTAPTTGVTAREGSVWVTWQDNLGIHLIERLEGGPFTEVPVTGASAGTTPAVAASTESEGVVTLVWYEPATQDLHLGVWGDPDEILVANPSPVPTVSIAPPSAEGCGDDGKIDLEIVGTSANVFDKNCLVGPASQPFEVTFNNEGGTHNFQVLPEVGSTEVIDGTELVAGPVKQVLPLELEGADYYFQCLAHPTTMFGTLAVVKGAK